MEFNKEEFLWEQKYRPGTVKDVALPASLMKLFTNFVTKGAIQNLVLYSDQPGTGKTTTGLALCNDIGCINPLFINGSLQTSVEDIRSDVVDYTSSVSLVDKSHKVVFIDEAERLSPQALDSLKGLMERVSKSSRFIFTTNDLDSIPGPVISRCQVISFEFDEKEQMDVMKQMFKRVVEILDNENVAHPDMAALAQIIKLAQPDTRKLISELQRLSTINNNVIDASVVSKVAIVDMEAFGKLLKSKDYGALKTFLMQQHKYMGKSFFTKMFNMLEPMVTEQSSPLMVTILGDNQKHFVKTPDLYIFWLNICVKILIDCEFK